MIENEPVHIKQDKYKRRDVKNYYKAKNKRNNYKNDFYTFNFKRIEGRSRCHILEF